MKKFFILLAIACLGIFAACNNAEVQRLTAQRDSLLVVTHMQDSLQAEIDSYMETLATTLDSIRVQESILSIRVDENGKPLKKEQIQENLQLVSEVLQRQRQRIDELDAKLVEQNKTTAYYKKLVNHLRKEIEAKDAEIVSMSEELNKKNATIANLNTKVNSLEKDVKDISNKSQKQEEKINEQAKTINEQSVKLNTAYVFIGTKKELKKAGLLKKGVVSGGRVNTEGLDLSVFKQMDIRKVQQMTLDSYKPKVLTAHPASSYEITVDEDSFDDISYFKIKNPSDFWSLSNFLIIQL